MIIEMLSFIYGLSNLLYYQVDCVLLTSNILDAFLNVNKYRAKLISLIYYILT